MTPAAKSSSPHLKPAVTQFFEAIKDWDFDAIEKLFSEDFIHTTLPASANDPPKNKKYGIEHAKAVAALLGNPHLDVRRRVNRRTTLARARSGSDVFHMTPTV